MSMSVEDFLHRRMNLVAYVSPSGGMSGGAHWSTTSPCGSTLRVMMVIRGLKEPRCSGKVSKSRREISVKCAFCCCCCWWPKLKVNNGDLSSTGEPQISSISLDTSTPDLTHVTYMPSLRIGISAPMERVLSFSLRFQRLLEITRKHPSHLLPNTLLVPIIQRLWEKIKLRRINHRIVMRH